MAEESLVSAEAQAPAAEETINLEGESAENETSEVQSEQVESSDEATSEDEYLYAGKYKSIEDLEKGYKEVVQKFTAKSPGAPEDYEFDFSENEVLKDTEISLDDDAIFEAAIPAFKKAGITQEQAQMVVEAVLEKTREQLPDIGAELEKLGPNGAEIVSEVNKFVSKSLTEAEQDIAVLLGQSAEGIQFLDKFRQMSAERSIPSSLDTPSLRSSAEAIEEAYAYKRSTANFDNDTAAKRRYEKMMDDAMKLQLREEKQRRG